MALHEDRARAGSFGEDAEAYDRTRPTYPAEVVDRLLAETPVTDPAGGHDVLDVGCGTGKLGRGFAERGCRVVGVEPDERMAAVSRRHGIDVDVAPFETWDDAGRRFDLVVAGQAWHWIDPGVGARRAADVLRSGGRVALVWNLGRPDGDLEAAIDAVYAEHFPENDGTAGHHAHHDGLRGLRDLDASGRFEPQEVWSHAWRVDHTTAEWLAQLVTHSNHRLLPDDRRARLLDAVGAVVDGAGGTLTLRYETVVVTAVRR
jgi:SAM-dependent methyltransferase